MQAFQEGPYTLPVGSYPSPFLGYLLFYITDPNHKTRYPKKGVGYEPPGTVETLNFGNYGIFLIMGSAGFISSTIVVEVVLRPGSNPESPVPLH